MPARFRFRQEWSDGAPGCSIGADRLALRRRRRSWRSQSGKPPGSGRVRIILRRAAERAGCFTPTFRMPSIAVRRSTWCKPHLATARWRHPAPATPAHGWRFSARPAAAHRSRNHLGLHARVTCDPSLHLELSAHHPPRRARPPRSAPSPALPSREWRKAMRSRPLAVMSIPSSG